MKNRICLVTGATNGIGFAASMQLAKLGATVVVTGRNPQKTDATVQSIRATTGNNSVEGLVADFSSLQQVRGLAQAFLSRYDKLHVLMNNAGLWVTRRAVSADGFELTFAVNHLAPFLLTHLLLDTMKAAAPARIVNVSSQAHWRGELNFDDLQSETKFSGWTCYATSKLVNILFTAELARRLEGSGVTANSLHPGVVATGLVDSNKGLTPWIAKLIKPFLWPPERGAATCTYLASSPQVDGITGKYFDNCREAPVSATARNTRTAQRLWQISEKLVGLGETKNSSAA
ncbi:MAG: short-chain dehydrogenase [Acidobacteria bacterium RIFCSPLOWO2_12_FULL_54_10]|nr:MAG: short-chain dehydrogenase [Acidobacteria bacterium RIFCSPLOWO2_12_FULL_54_10]